MAATSFLLTLPASKETCLDSAGTYHIGISAEIRGGLYTHDAGSLRKVELLAPKCRELRTFIQSKMEGLSSSHARVLGDAHVMLFEDHRKGVLHA